MKVLITGAGGQVGQALKITAPASAEIISCTHHQLDIGNEIDVQRVIEQHAPNVIINAAAYTAVDRAESEKDLAHRINADGPRYLAQAASGVGARLIHISTDFVFNGASSTPYTPDSKTDPLSTYGATKLAGETAVQSALPTQSVVLRTSWVYADQGHNFVKTMLRVMSQQASVRVVADQIGTPTSAQSVAKTIWTLVENPQRSGIHHWTDAGVASWYDFAEAIGEEGAILGMLPANITVVPIRTKNYPTPARRPAFSVLDTSTLSSLNIPRVHWRKQLRVVLEAIKHA
jgi:dTDP-4-dehydrorhamnose reductase